MVFFYRNKNDFFIRKVIFFSIQIRIKKPVDVHEPFETIEMNIFDTEKNINYRLFYKSPTEYGIEYPNARNTVKNTIIKARDEYYENKLQENTSNSKGM